MPNETPRWKYRFDNYQRAFILLREGMEQIAKPGASQLEKEGVVQRFEFTLELAWKTMRDYLESEGEVFDQFTPRTVVRKAFEANVIRDGQVWMDAMDARNKMAHTYDSAEFERIVVQIRRAYLAALEELHAFLLPRSVQKNARPPTKNGKRAIRGPRRGR